MRNEDATTLVDQQTNLIRQLSGLVDVQVIQTDHGGIELTTSDGTTLVAGGQSFALSTQTGVGGNQQVMAGAADITGTLTGGSLAGTIQIRDQEIPRLPQPARPVGGWIFECRQHAPTRKASI